MAHSAYLFPGRGNATAHLPTRQYPRIVASWVLAVVLDRHAYATYIMRRTKASLITAEPRTFRAVQILLGHTKLESTVECLSIEVAHALEKAEQTED